MDMDRTGWDLMRSEAIGHGTHDEPWTEGAFHIGPLRTDMIEPTALPGWDRLTRGP